MVSQENYVLIKRAIKIYNKLVGKTYLILYKTNAKQDSKFMETSILEENFWHLVGCRIDESLKYSKEQKLQVYLDCCCEKDVSVYLEYTRQPQDVSKKANVVVNLFDFVSNAKSIRLCHTDGSPEASMFQVGAGSNKGIIGYCKTERGMIPKTAQQKSIFQIDPNASDKIILILSKTNGAVEYNQIEYAISKKIFPSIIRELPMEITVKNYMFD